MRLACFDCRISLTFQKLAFRLREDKVDGV